MAGGVMDLTVLCEQFEAAYEAGLIHIRLGPPADSPDRSLLSPDPFDIQPRLPVLRAERRKSGDPVLTIDRGLIR